MNRREIIALLGGAAAWPVAARAQQGERMRRIGVLMGIASDDPEGQLRVVTLRMELERLGWINGNNIQIDYRWAAGNPELTDKYAAELVALRPDVILSQSTPPFAALLRQTRTIPIVFVGVTDPVESGLVTSLARPSGNATGFTNFEYSIGGKWVEILKEIAPQVTRMLVLEELENTTARKFFPAVEAAARSLGIGLVQTDIRSNNGSSEVERAIVAFARSPNGGLIALPGNVIGLRRSQIFELALQYRLPAVYPFRYLAADGGLVSYGVDQPDLYRRAASYLDRVLKGVTPADLPVQQPTKFELVINLKTAKSLGLDVPVSLQQRADEVIE
jgi:putative tryptophan/tyrosine transport system substrate-binding protein